jgi:hypothetical protein
MNSNQELLHHVYVFDFEASSGTKDPSSGTKVLAYWYKSVNTDFDATPLGVAGGSLPDVC